MAVEDPFLSAFSAVATPGASAATIGLSMLQSNPFANVGEATLAISLSRETVPWSDVLGAPLPGLATAALRP